jgi:hypothetical protein
MKVSSCCGNTVAQVADLRMPHCPGGQRTPEASCPTYTRGRSSVGRHLDAVRSDLCEDGYAYRFAVDDRPLGDAEGAFLLCGFIVSLARRYRGDPVGCWAGAVVYPVPAAPDTIRPRCAETWQRLS